MRSRPFTQVDVFTAVPLRGNPLAVVLDASELDDATMQRFARWTNLSETTFVLPPSEAGRAQGADYRVRIFTPGGELQFAGHPTLGTCHAWLENGGQPQAAGHVVQECGVGLVKIARDGQRLAFAAPALRQSAPDEALLAGALQALHLQPAQLKSGMWLDNGTKWLGLLLDDPATVLALEPDHGAIKKLGAKLGVAAIYPAQEAPDLIARSSREARAFSASENTAASAQLEVRGFAAPIGVEEDPVTGSLNAGLAQWLTSAGLLKAPYISNQGVCLGRDGWIYITQDVSGQLWVGGDTATCIRGEVRL